MIISVQHTGTRFLVGELGINAEHVTDQNMPKLRSLKTATVPVRHPARVYESWRRRGRPIAGCTQQYRNLISLSQGTELDYVLVEDMKGTPITIFHTHNAEITDEMRRMVPDFVMDWYREIISDERRA